MHEDRIQYSTVLSLCPGTSARVGACRAVVKLEELLCSGTGEADTAVDPPAPAPAPDERDGADAGEADEEDHEAAAEAIREVSHAEFCLTKATAESFLRCFRPQIWRAIPQRDKFPSEAEILGLSGPGTVLFRMASHLVPTVRIVIEGFTFVRHRPPLPVCGLLLTTYYAHQTPRVHLAIKPIVSTIAGPSHDGTMLVRIQRHGDSAAREVGHRFIFRSRHRRAVHSGPL